MRGEIKYSYCLDENNNLVHIRDIGTKEYKKCGTPHNPKQTSALQCQYYRVLQNVMTTFDHNELIKLVTEIKK